MAGGPYKRFVSVDITSTVVAALESGSDLNIAIVTSTPGAKVTLGSKDGPAAGYCAVLDIEEGKRLAHALGDNKAIILSNHGLLTVGQTSVDEAAWWFIAMERTCQAQLLAEAAGDPILIDRDHADKTAKQVGPSMAGWRAFQPLYDWIVSVQPELLQD